MFRAAFPTAPEDAEKVEASWVKANFDSYGANGTGRDSTSKLRLAGTWIHPDVARTLATNYSLEHVVEPLAGASPDPSQEYRRSTKPQSPHVNANPSPTKGGPRIEVNAPPSSPTPASQPAAKRRKESSPVTAAPIPPVEALPPPRRSGRNSVSPAPQAVRPPRSKGTRTTRSQAKPPSVNGRISTRLTPAESDHAPPAEDEEGDDIAEVPGPDMKQDIAEQKEMIAKLKAERDAKEAVPSKAPSAEPIAKTDSQSSKRGREDEDEKPLQFQFKEREAEDAVAVRPIASNRRLSLDLEPQQKSAAWGALWFAAGLAAA